MKKCASILFGFLFLFSSVAILTESLYAFKFCGEDKNGHAIGGSEVCGWIAVPYCAAAGLAGFFSGFNLFCSYDVGMHISLSLLIS